MRQAPLSGPGGDAGRPLRCCCGRSSSLDDLLHMCRLVLRPIQLLHPLDPRGNASMFEFVKTESLNIADRYSAMIPDRDRFATQMIACGVKLALRGGGEGGGGHTPVDSDVRQHTTQRLRSQFPDIPLRAEYLAAIPSCEVDVVWNATR